MPMEYFLPLPVVLAVRAINLNAMLWTIFFILIILWLIGILTAYTFGGLIHLLLIIAVIVLIVRLVRGY